MSDYENVRRIIKTIDIEYNHSTFFVILVNKSHNNNNKLKNSIDIVGLYNVITSNYIVHFRLDLMASK